MKMTSKISLTVKSLAFGILLAGASATSAETQPVVEGTVTKINASAQKLTIDHGPIASLDMPSMTMVFKAGDPAMLTKVKPGDKIKFIVERVNGQLTVVEIKE